jgi:hypothetical protein
MRTTGSSAIGVTGKKGEVHDGQHSQEAQMKKLAAALFLSSGFVMAAAPAALAAPPAAACHGLHTAHESVPHLDNGTETAHDSIPHCPMH